MSSTWVEPPDWANRRETWDNTDGLGYGIPPEVLAENVRLLARVKTVEAERDDLFTRASIASGDARYLRAALDRVRALCDVSEWLNAEAEYWYGEWCAGRPAPAMNNGWGLGPRLSRSALGRVRAAIEGSE